jgi:hypothetical protein
MCDCAERKVPSEDKAHGGDAARAIRLQREEEISIAETEPEIYMAIISIYHSFIAELPLSVAHHGTRLIVGVRAGD